MRRREFIAVLAGGAATWPLAVRAQQREQMRRIGALMSTTADDPHALVNITAFAQGLQEFGWRIGTNVQIDYRWGDGNFDLYRRYAAELVALKPDAILAHRRDPATGKPHRADRVCNDSRSGWRRLGRKPLAARRQRHRIYSLRIQHRREMAGIAKTGGAQHDASGRSSRSRCPGWNPMAC